jgi:hypothetical protein
VSGITARVVMYDKYYSSPRRSPSLQLIVFKPLVRGGGKRGIHPFETNK